MKAFVTSIGYWGSEYHLNQLIPDSPTNLKYFSGLVDVQLGDFEARFTDLEIDRAHPFFPKLSDLKVMRSDVVASVIIAQTIVSRNNRFVDHLSEMMLMVANSNFIDNEVLDFKELTKAIENIQLSENGFDRNQKLSSEISPLIPLRTLTNGTESFIAQYVGIGGENATFGSTCNATAHALKAGLDCLQLGISDLGLIGGSNFGNAFSFLNNYQFEANAKNYCEGTATSFFMLESENSIRETGSKALLEIMELTLNEIPDVSVDWIFYAGGFTVSHQELIKEKLAMVKGNRVFSWFPFMGDLGCADLGFAIAAAERWLQNGETALIYLQDGYGESSSLIIKKP